MDASELAVNQARENAVLNGVDSFVDFVCADVFEYLPALEKEGKKFDLVVLGSSGLYKIQKFD